MPTPNDIARNMSEDHQTKSSELTEDTPPETLSQTASDPVNKDEAESAEAAAELYSPPLAEEFLIGKTNKKFSGIEHYDADYEYENDGEDDGLTVIPPLPLSVPLEMDTELGPDYPLPRGRLADRELSWMAFNERVLEQAEDPELPLLESAWFLTIFSSNLDEFNMVRVAGLKRRIAAGIARTAASGLTPMQILEGVRIRTRGLTSRQINFFHEVLMPGLKEAGIHLIRWDEISNEDKIRMHSYFRKWIFPVVTPLAVDPSHPFPYISGLSLNLAIAVRNPVTNKSHFARVKVPDSLPRLINVDTAGREGRPENFVSTEAGATFIPIEQIISAHLDHLFPGMDILECHAFRVTRNEDLEVEEDDAENLLTAMEQELLRRRFGPAVRLEVSENISHSMLDLLSSKLEIPSADVYRIPGPLDLTCLNDLHQLDLPHLKFPRFVPVTPRGLAEVESSRPSDIFAAITNRDILLHHPYDSFVTSVQQFIAQAAADPQVLAIKQTLYRTSSDSPIVSALIAAAQSGKQVVAIVEIKARFDEDANISWARKLERAGVHVVYGMVGLKTHCKLSLVVRQESDGLHRYCHIGTGNYHPNTARGYEDIGLLTCDTDITQDLTLLFNQMSGYAPLANFRKLLVAPRSIRKGLIKRIEREIDHHEAGLPARISFKVNSIVDEKTIDALYRASQRGVKVDIVVRGICALRPGIIGLSEKVRVRSILGRYLEHSRIYAFENAGEPEVWIGSADLMHRNLDRRVEALVKISDPDQVNQLVTLVRKEAAPTTASWRLRKNGTWKRHTRSKTGEPLDDVQEILMKAASKRITGRSS